MTATDNSNRGFILWLTGLSGAGKSTLARTLARALARELEAVVLEDEHDESVETRVLARAAASAGKLAINATISPLREARARARAEAASAGLAFVEVYLEAAPETLVARDPHGDYQRAFDSDSDSDIAGVTAAYEPPRCPEIRLRSDLESVGQSTRIVLRQLERRGLIGFGARERRRAA
ncbi:MAG: adenylyl-sulfate kinase [Myxococcales bacterium]|nr:adenylyl-sulfate kinase [Myxococcales bacterium]